MYSRVGFIREKVAGGMHLVMLAARFVLALGSCADRRDVADVLSEAFALVSEGKYDDAQLKALEAEELMNNSASMADREALARLYGIVYYRQNLRDKAKGSNLHALEYAIELDETALISRIRLILDCVRPRAKKP